MKRVKLSLKNINLLLALLLIHPIVKHKPVLNSKGSMIQQNQEIDRLNLPRIVNDNQLHQLISQGELVKLEESNALSLQPISEDRKYARSWVRNFVSDMASAFFHTFDKRLLIDSAVRTAEQQSKLIRINRFAAPAYGALPSSHLAGITVDIAKRKYTLKERKWIVNYLQDAKNKGFIIPIEEPYCFHVAVKEAYNELQR